MDIGRNHVYPGEVSDALNRQARLERIAQEEAKATYEADDRRSYLSKYKPIGDAHTSSPHAAARRKAKNKAQRQARSKSRR